MAERFHVLPFSGGLFDQPARYIVRMEAVMRADEEQEKVEDAKREAQRKVEQKASGIRRQGT